MLKNKFIYGLVIGSLLPIIFYPVFDFMDASMVKHDVINKLTGQSNLVWAGFKESTIYLFAICINLIPTFFANKRRLDEFIRGIMIPTVIFSFIWFFYFKSGML